MQVPVQITQRNVSISEDAQSRIREKAAWLERYYDRITGCRVVVEAPHRHQHQGLLYNVQINLTVPGTELVVKREANEDLKAAIRDSFDAARRQLEDHVRRRRGQVKVHPGVPRARVVKIFRDEGYGFLETPDGREIYFHENSVTNGGFARMEVGLDVHYAEEEGIKGPQASTVRPTGKHAQ